MYILYQAMPTREGKYPRPLACEVGWPVISSLLSTSLVVPPYTHSLLNGERASIQARLKYDLNCQASTQQTSALTAILSCS